MGSPGREKKESKASKATDQGKAELRPLWWIW